MKEWTAEYVDSFIRESYESPGHESLQSIADAHNAALAAAEDLQIKTAVRAEQAQIQLAAEQEQSNNRLEQLQIKESDLQLLRDELDEQAAVILNGVVTVQQLREQLDAERERAENWRKVAQDTQRNLGEQLDAEREAAARYRELWHGSENAQLRKQLEEIVKAYKFEPEITLADAIEKAAVALAKIGGK